MGHSCFFRTSILTLAALAAAIALPGSATAQPALPDLTPTGLIDFTIGSRFGFRTFEWSILTANIGGQDWIRPRRGASYRLPQIYEYALFKCDDGGDPDYTYSNCVQVDRRRKNTICTIDDTRRGNLFPCIQEHGARYTCGGTNGISRGWADDYFRGLSGQWVFLPVGDERGSYLVTMELDPLRFDPVTETHFYDLDPNDPALSDSGKDATHDNNFAYVKFYYDGPPPDGSGLLSVNRIYESFPFVDPTDPDQVALLTDSSLLTADTVCPAP